MDLYGFIHRVHPFCSDICVGLILDKEDPSMFKVVLSLTLRSNGRVHDLETVIAIDRIRDLESFLDGSLRGIAAQLNAEGAPSPMDSAAFDRRCFTATESDGLPTLAYLLRDSCASDHARFDIALEVARKAFDAGREIAKC